MEEVAGYRVLRVAGRGARTRLLLGFDGGRTVVLKVADAGDARAAAELEALDRAAGEHVVELLDVAADEHATTLVLERLPGGTLADLLETRGSLAAGEAVTILAPLATTLERMHAAGVAHGALSLATIGFRADGAPTLLGFGAAQTFPPGAPEVVREGVPGVIADREGLRELVALVLARVAGPRAEAARRLTSAATDLAPAELATALFGFAAPEAVRFDADADVAPDPRVGVHDDVGVVDAVLPVVPAGVLALVPDAFRAPVTAVLERVVAVWGAWSATRRRLVLGGGAAALTVVVAVAAFPAPPRSSAAAPNETPAALEEERPAADLPEDPVEAAVVLLERRRDCLRELSALCLDGVVQPGSAAQEDDVALVRAIAAGQEVPVDGTLTGRPVLVERLGDSALVDLPPGSSPATLLLLRTANGWRIRSYLDAPAVDVGAGGAAPG